MKKIDIYGEEFDVKYSIVNHRNKEILTVEGWKYYKLNFWGHYKSPKGERLMWFNSLEDAEAFAVASVKYSKITDFTFCSNYTTFDGEITQNY